jgi:hypothetical protein
MQLLSVTPKPELRAYVRTTNPTGAPIYWGNTNFTITYDAAGTTQLPSNETFMFLDASYATWANDAMACAKLKFTSTMRSGIEVGNDGVNLVIFREQACTSCGTTNGTPTWCQPLDGGKQMCLDMKAAGITTLFFVNDTGSSRNGQIVDADTQLNGVNFQIADNSGQSLGPSKPNQAVLQNTATHEAGHFLGLDHTCWDERSPHRMNNLGMLTPDCFTDPLPPEVTQATMYNFQMSGETSKETLTPDDIAGVCAIYTPRAHGCCAVADESDPGHGNKLLCLLTAIGLLGPILRNKSRKGRARQGSAT